jgi:hypothetical protein
VTERIEGETTSDAFDSQRVRPLVTDLKGRPVHVLCPFHYTTRTVCHPIPAPQPTQVISTSSHLRVSCWATGSASLRARWAGRSGGVLRRKASATRWGLHPPQRLVPSTSPAMLGAYPPMPPATSAVSPLAVFPSAIWRGCPLVILQLQDQPYEQSRHAPPRSRPPIPPSSHVCASQEAQAV